MFRVAICANTIRPRATIQLTTMEFVIGKLNGRAISTALAERPCSSAFDDSVGVVAWSAALFDAAVDAIHDVESVARLKLELRVIRTVVSNSILMNIPLVRAEPLMQ